MALWHLPELRAAADQALPGIQWSGNDGVVAGRAGVLQIRAAHDHQTTQLVASMPIPDVPVQAWFGTRRMHLAGAELLPIQGPLAAEHRVAGRPEQLVLAALTPELQAQLAAALTSHRHILIEDGLARIPLGRLNTDVHDIARTVQALDALCVALRTAHRQALAQAHAHGGEQAARAAHEALQAQAEIPLASPWITVGVVVAILALVALAFVYLG